MPNTTPPKCKIPLQSPGLWSLQPLKSPTRFYEDPEKQSKTIKMTSGGARPGAGRKAGTPNRRKHSGPADSALPLLTRVLSKVERGVLAVSGQTEQHST